MERESAHQRCSKCNKSFQVLADEAGTHDCPWCGFGPESDLKDFMVTWKVLVRAKDEDEAQEKAYEKVVNGEDPDDIDER